MLGDTGDPLLGDLGVSLALVGTGSPEGSGPPSPRYCSRRLWRARAKLPSWRSTLIRVDKGRVRTVKT